MNTTYEILIPFFQSSQTVERLVNLNRCVARLNSINITPTVGCNSSEGIEGNFKEISHVSEHFNKCDMQARLIGSSTTDKFFVLDADIIVPDYFLSWIELCILPNQAYFPICYRFNKGKEENYEGDIDSMDDEDVSANGGWCNGGYGLFGMMHSDWDKYGLSFNREIGKSWGVEDDYIHYLTRSKMKVFRHKCPGLFHIWHPKGYYYKNSNHEDKSGEDFHEVRRAKYDKFMKKMA